MTRKNNANPLAISITALDPLVTSSSLIRFVNTAVRSVIKTLVLIKWIICYIFMQITIRNYKGKKVSFHTLHNSVLEID